MRKLNSFKLNRATPPIIFSSFSKVDPILRVGDSEVVGSLCLSSRGVYDIYKDLLCSKFNYLTLEPYGPDFALILHWCKSSRSSDLWSDSIFISVSLSPESGSSALSWLTGKRAEGKKQRYSSTDSIPHRPFLLLRKGTEKSYCYDKYVTYCVIGVMDYIYTHNFFLTLYT